MKKGFSLVELLVVIVIMGIVALVTVPIVLSMIDSMNRTAFEKGVNGVIRAVVQDSNTTDYKGGPYRLFNQQLRNNNRTVGLTGEVRGEGTILLNENGDLKVGIFYDGRCAKKDFTDPVIIFTEGPCEIPQIPSMIDPSFFKELPLNTNITDAMLTAFPYRPTTYPGGQPNQLVMITNPWGQQDIAWRGTNNGAAGAGGGFSIGNVANFRMPIDNTKNYRFSAWFRIDGNTGSSILYHTYLFSSNSSSTILSITDADGSAPTTNPNISNSNRGIWVLLVAYLTHHGSINEGALPSAYRVDGSVISTRQARKMTPEANFFSARFQGWGASDGVIYIYRPRVDLIDGTEPTISDLLSGQENSNLIY